MMRFFKWSDCLKDLVEDRIIGTSYNRYLRTLVSKDLEERLERTNDKFDSHTIISALIAIYSEERQFPKTERLKELKSQLHGLNIGKGKIRKSIFINYD